MKKLTKILAIALAVVMLFALSAVALAADDDEVTTGTIVVKNATYNHTYTAYKVFDATYDGNNVSYKTAAANASLLDEELFGWSAEDAEHNINVWAKEGVAQADILDWVEQNYDKFGGSAIPGVFDDTDSTVTFSGLDFGYYYITSSLGSAVTINTAAPTAEVYDKNEVAPVDPKKEIVTVDGANVASETPLKSTDAHVGSIVGFKVTAKTTNWTGKEDAAVITEKWELTDTPSKMTIDASTVVVKFNGTQLTADAFTAEVDASGKLTITVPMVDEDGNSIYAAPITDDEENGLIPIEVTYSATITADAGDSPAKNEIPSDHVDVYTYAFKVSKTDGTDPLPGAQFELWSAKGVENGTAAALTFIDNKDGTYTFYEKKGDDDNTEVVTTLDMTTNTSIVIKGLDNKWAYTLKEITVPEGYNPAEDIDIAGNSLTKVEKASDATLENTSLFEQEVINKAGELLPSTGGIGTRIFYIVGAILVLGAGVVLVTKRKMDVQ